MAVGFKSTELFKKLIQTCFWQLFLPHSSSNSFTISTYKSATNTYFPDAIAYSEKYTDILKELPYRVQIERPELYSAYTAGLTTLVRLVERRESHVSLAPLFTLGRILYGDDMKSGLDWSLLLQVMCAYSDTFKGEVLLILPTERRDDLATEARPIGIRTVDADHHSDSKDIAPFWRWYLRLIYPYVNTIGSQEEQESALSDIFKDLYFPFCPNSLETDTVILPLPNAVRMQSMLRAVTPLDGQKRDSAVRLYSAIQFVTFGMTDVDIIGDSQYIPTDISDFNNYLKNAASKEASIVSRYSITDFDRSQVAGALENFRLAELEAIRSASLKDEVVPDDEHDPSLDEDSHDPSDDNDIDPTIGRTVNPQIANEATDLDDDHIEDSDNNDTQTDGDDETDGLDGSTGDDNEFNGSSDSGSDLGSDPTESGDLGGNPTEGSGLGNDMDPNTKKDEEPVSSRNAMSNKAYKAAWGSSNPLKLANDSDVPGDLYRRQLCRLNHRLRMDPGEAIPKHVKNTLHEWCKFWVHGTDVRCSISLVKKLGLTKYLTV